MPTQYEIADWLGLDQSQVSRRLEDLKINAATTDMRTVVRAYCAALRAVAAGRSLDLVQQRARLAQEQADKVAMDNAVRRKELAPVGLLEASLADVSRQLVAILELIPVQIRRQVSTIDAQALQIISDQIDSARIAAARIELAANFADGLDDHTPGGDEGSGGAGAQAAAQLVAMGG